MNPLNDQHALIVHDETVIAKLPLTRHEIVRRQFNLLPVKQSDHMLFKQVEIYGVKRFVVFLAKLVEWSMFAVDKVIVKRDTNRLLTDSHTVAPPAVFGM